MVWNVSDDMKTLQISLDWRLPYWRYDYSSKISDTSAFEVALSFENGNPVIEWGGLIRGGRFVYTGKGWTGGIWNREYRVNVFLKN